ncbi:uncharacterized protein [Spinacia oleracea]|uniref:Reverse transcriptase zinc-binding domain-containing protein n=1 Tax=Spinacia oleracea TaxID=3562 RepID=A0ABM3RIK5_SPIOL|nr:uncharacterized protein LOC130469934 [Spinacia oleracea]
MYIKLCTPSEITQWARYIWNRLSVPKHRFSLWLALLDRHKTKYRLHQYGISTDNLCAICGSAPETSAHLFFECSYSLDCLAAVTDWLGLSCTRKNFLQILNWTRRYCKSAFKRKIIFAAVAGLVYAIWRPRNTLVWEGAVPAVATVIQTLKYSVKQRAIQLCQDRINELDKSWLFAL